MASEISGIFSSDLHDTILKSKILVVGAGGIGCELLKNLVLTGFNDIEIIDLDTIDVTNLNRQFLFHKQHVGKPKSEVARESALAFNPNSKIIAHHDSIMNNEYGLNYFKKFNLVLNALDNRAARNHVNRMCLSANVPLVESGTAGYLGQVTVIKKGVTECYECQPKPHQKTYPGCTIRNTPSELIHCIVWAKHLFNQLFGEADPDEDVSPDREDPELEANGSTPQESQANDKGNVDRVSTRQWAINCDYDPDKLFKKLFHDDVTYLLSMEKLWQTRRKPEPLDKAEILKHREENSEAGIRDQVVWGIDMCCKKFDEAVNKLKLQFKSLEEGKTLVWDKDDVPAMDFVTAAANIRAQIFHIAKKSRFEIKSMAGNIIPAIATTNAVIAGCIVMEAIKILDNNFDECKTVYLTRKPNPRKKVLVPCELTKANPKCYVCSEKPEVSVRVNLDTMTVKHLEDKILKGALNMVAPDAEIEGRGVILISSEEGETECNNDKVLKDFGLVDGSVLACDDFLQNYNLRLYIFHADDLEHGVEFEMKQDPKEMIEKAKNDTEAEKMEVEKGEKRKSAGGDEAPTAKKRPHTEIEEIDDDIVLVE